MSSYCIATSSSAASSPIASESPGTPTASGRPDSRMSVEPSSFDAASTSQVRLKDAYLGGLMEEQRGDQSHQEEENSEDSDNLAAGTWYYKEEPVAQNNKAWGKPFAQGASSSVDQESQKNTEATWDHYLHKSPDTSNYMEAVFSMVRKICGEQPGYPMEDVKLAIWRIFMNTTLRAAVHIVKDFDANLRFVKDYLRKTTGQLFKEKEELISGQTETTGISWINFQDLRWVSTNFLHNRACQYATAKVYVFSDSVLCLGRMGHDSVESWKKQIQWYSENDYFSELNRIDGRLVEFEWKIFPGFTTVGILNQIQLMMGELQCKPEDFMSRIIFMSMFIDSVWMQMEMMNCVSILKRQLQNMQKYFLAVIGLSWHMDPKRSGT